MKFNEPLPFDTFLYKQRKESYWGYSFQYPYEHEIDIKVKNAFTLCPYVYPIKVTSIPFYTQLAKQISKQINKTVGGKVANKYEYDMKAVESGRHSGPPYVYRMYSVWTAKIPELRYNDIVQNTYTRDHLKIHVDGYSYGALEPYCPEKCIKIPLIYIRWKSNLDNYDYIEPDDGLELDNKSITFEICTTIPDVVATELGIDPTKPLDCLAWVDMMRNAFCEQDSKTNRGPKNNFSFEIIGSPDYPDVTFEFLLDADITDELCKCIEDEFYDFSQKWEEKTQSGIHFICIDTENISDKTVPVTVDFGDCDPKIITDFVKQLKTSGLPIVKLVMK